MCLTSYSLVSRAATSALAVRSQHDRSSGRWRVPVGPRYPFASRSYRKLVEYGNAWRWPHVGRQYRKSIVYRCIWSGRQYCTIVKAPFYNSHTRQTCRKIAALDYFCRLDHEILFSGRAASEHVRKSLLLYIQFVWVLRIGTKLDLTC